MKRCPYCAEEIRDEAVICRFCFRRVKRNPYRVLIIILVILAASILAKTHQREVSKAVADINVFFNGVRYSCRELYKAIKSFPESVRSLAEYKNKVGSINKIIGINTDSANSEVTNE